MATVGRCRQGALNGSGSSKWHDPVPSLGQPHPQAFGSRNLQFEFPALHFTNGRFELSRSIELNQLCKMIFENPEYRLGLVQAVGQQHSR